MANYYGFKKTILKLFKVTFIEKNTKSVFSKYYFLKNSYLRNLLKFFDLKIARKPFFFNYYSLKKKYFLEMSRKKNRRKIGRKSLFWTPCSSKTPTLDIAEQFQKNWRKPRKYHALKKIFLILEVSWNNFAEKKIKWSSSIFCSYFDWKIGWKSSCFKSRS